MCAYTTELVVVLLLGCRSVVCLLFFCGGVADFWWPCFLWFGCVGLCWNFQIFLLLFSLDDWVWRLLALFGLVCIGSCWLFWGVDEGQIWGLCAPLVRGGAEWTWGLWRWRQHHTPELAWCIVCRVLCMFGCLHPRFCLRCTGVGLFVVLRLWLWLYSVRQVWLCCRRWCQGPWVWFG